MTDLCSAWADLQARRRAAAEAATDAEAPLLRAALEVAGWSAHAAAQVLGLSCSGVRRAMGRHPGILRDYDRIRAADPTRAGRRKAAHG